MKKISNEKELFELFCDKDNCFGLYQEPFLDIDHNEVWAINGYKGVAVKAELVSGKYHKRKLTKNIGFGTPCNAKVTLKAIKDALAKLPMVEEEDMEDVDCDECDGSGEVECEYIDNNGVTHEVTADCPICFGSGYVGAPKKTGKMIADFSTPIKLGEAYFMGYMLDILAQSMELLGLETLTMTHHGGFGVGRAKACELQADGVRFLLAPMLVDDVSNAIEIEITK